MWLMLECWCNSCVMRQKEVRVAFQTYRWQKTPFQILPFIPALTWFGLSGKKQKKVYQTHKRLHAADTDQTFFFWGSGCMPTPLCLLMDESSLFVLCVQQITAFSLDAQLFSFTALLTRHDRCSPGIFTLFWCPVLFYTWGSNARDHGTFL